MSEQDSKGHLGAWLAFFGVLVTASVTLYLGTHNANTQPHIVDRKIPPVDPVDPVTPINSGLDPCTRGGAWTIVNVTQQATMPAHYSDGMLIVDWSMENNTQAHLRFHCTAHGGNMTLVGAGSEAYGQVMPFSFNIFDGEYKRNSDTSYLGRTPSGEKILLTQTGD